MDVMDIEEAKDVDNNADIEPESVAMLAQNWSLSESTPTQPPSSLRNNLDDDYDDDETYDAFDMEDMEVPDFSTLRPGSELESPGSVVSDSQRSWGHTSSISDRSDNSRTVLIAPTSASSSGGNGNENSNCDGGGGNGKSKLFSFNFSDKNKHKQSDENNSGVEGEGGGDEISDRRSHHHNHHHHNKRSGVDSLSHTNPAFGDHGKKHQKNNKIQTDFDDDEEEEDLSEENNTCKIGLLSPPCFQSCANIKMFVVFMCILQVVATAVTTGYFNSVITTIEKRFEIGSSISGLIAAAYEFGNLVAVIFVSYLGTSRHIPKWIGSGVILMGIGSLLISLPHIVAPKYTIRSGVSHNETEEGNICRGQSGASGHASWKTPGSPSEQDVCISEHSGNWAYVLVLVAAQIMIGTGGTPIMTLGVTYVDSHVPKEKSPTYLAFIHASGALGPVLGYALGALLLQYYVDTFTHDVQITPSSPRWIGAWWGGFIICGIVLMSLSLPFLAYPRVLVKEKRAILEAKSAAQRKEEEAHAHEVKHYGKSVKEIPKAVMHLLKNPVFAVLLPAICCEISIVSGFVVFLPKYLESQFGVSTSMANLFTGGIGIPGAVLGVLIGGYVMKRLSLTPRGAVQFVLLLNILAISGFSFFFFLGCDNVKIAGANFPYFNSTGHKIFEANLTSRCNQNCACSPNHIQPICGINGITYFSPCHAGCTGANTFYQPGNNQKAFNYSGCSCIRDGAMSQSSHEVIISPLATSGACKNRCEKLLPFLILLVGMSFCVAGTQMPLLMVTLRSVSTMERSFALGVQFVCMRLFAYIPSPIFFGQAIDQTCLLWSQSCGDNGSCLLYDMERFRYSYVGIAAGLKIVSLIFFVALWFIIRKRRLAADAEQAVSLDRQDAVVHLSDNENSKENSLDFRDTGNQRYNPTFTPHHEVNKTEDSPLRPSHLPIAIPNPNTRQGPPPRMAYSAPIPPPQQDPSQIICRSLYTQGNPQGHQEVMVMTPGSSNLQMAGSHDQESFL